MSRLALEAKAAPRARPNMPALRPLCAAMALALAGASAPVLAQLPSGGSVVGGSVGVITNGTQMTIRNSPNAILDWQTFSIGAANGVRFEQDSASSQVLNRVVGPDPSSIWGTLSSNGRVWLINPHGVLFGPDARIDAAGLVASTLNITNGDFLAGRFQFGGSASPPGASVLNQGRIETPSGGRVWLIGDSVRNEGLIQTPGGAIVLAAGQSVELLDSGSPNVVVRLTAPQNAVLNLGSLIASGAGGSIDLHGGIVNQQGLVRADSVGTDAAGRIVLRAQGDIELAGSSQTSASADGTGAGGTVSVESAGGTTLVAGRVAATSAQGQGGQVRLLGDQVGVYRQASVDASGATGGGAVLVGGDYQGSNPAVRHAQATYVGPEATLRADATGQGDGGKVIVWSDAATRVYGSLSARGGPAGGDGGLIETSGAYLDARPATVDATAVRGKPGIWLLDPNDIVIDSSEGGNRNIAEGAFPDLTTSDDAAIIDTLYLEGAIGRGNQVVIRTGSAGSNSQPGDITVAGNIHVDYAQWCEGSACNSGSLTLQAHRNIVVQPGVQITAQSGTLPLVLTADSDGNQDGGITIGSGAGLQTNGGSISMQGRGVQGIRISGATLDAGSAAIALTGSNTVLESGSSLNSSAPGDAIVIRTAGFDNQAGSEALSAPEGRWLVYASSLASTQLGGLPYDFVQFNAQEQPSPAQISGNGVLYAEQLALEGKIGRAYDATASAVLDASTIFSGQPAGYQVKLIEDGTGSFADRHVGTDKPIAVSSAPILDVTDPAAKPVYGYAGSVSYRGDITAAPLTITAAPNSKLYDGGGSAAATPVVSGLYGEDTVGGLAEAYADRNAGTGKTLNVLPSYTVNDGNGGANYSVTTVSDTSGVITPAPLTFVADRVVGYVAQTPPPLTGTVSGLMEIDQAALITWTSPPTSSPIASRPPGAYAIDGGIASPNYLVVQAPGNATALSLLPDDRPARPPQDELRTIDAERGAADRLAQPPRAPYSGGGVVDFSSLVRGDLFGPVNIRAMRPADLLGLLEARREFKRKLFADSIDKLEIDPSLADVQPCTSAEEAGTGLCRVTPEQVAQVQSQASQQPLAQPPGPQHKAALPLIERKIAVFFGINDYGDRRIPRLESAIPDADAVSRLFDERLGYEVRVVRNAGKAEIIRTLNQLSLEARPADSVVIYYAGHGYSLEKNGAGYWIPADAPVDDPRRWISNNDVSKLLAGYRTRQMAVISDSCYSGAFAREGAGAVGRDINADDVLKKRSVVVLSSGGDEPVSDEGKDGHSIFAWDLMQALKSLQNWTPGSTLFNEVRAAVTQEFPQTPHYGAVTAAGHQPGGDYLFEVR